tara:strand:- start:68 stop:553 length:486 start_codon:yes stop_codon:yes gene_type:complete
MKNYNVKVAKEIAIKGMLKVLNQDEFFHRIPGGIDDGKYYYDEKIFNSYVYKLVTEYTNKPRTIRRMLNTVRGMEVLSKYSICPTTVYTREDGSKWYAQYELNPILEPNVKQLVKSINVEKHLKLSNENTNKFTGDDYTASIFHKLNAANTEMFNEVLLQL